MLPALAGCVDPRGAIQSSHDADPEPGPERSIPESDDDGAIADRNAADTKTKAAESGHSRPRPYLPHVVVGIVDYGVNVYHEDFYRPTWTLHPCEYIYGFSCDIAPLNLTLGTDDYEAALAADQATWQSVVRGKWYWIPETVFFAVACHPVTYGICILAEGPASTGEGADEFKHGTAVSSSVTTENPDAGLVFLDTHSEGDGLDAERSLLEGGFPIDIFSVSRGRGVPNPIADEIWYSPPGLIVRSAGNDGLTTLIDPWRAHPDVIVVGGGYPRPHYASTGSRSPADVVSYMCRPAATVLSASATEEFCGTSVSAPTVAGALSKVVLAVRLASGYDGAVTGQYLDPISDLRVEDLREAMNLSASYDPEDHHPASRAVVGPVPLNPVAPWLQWGWGFYDAHVANATVRLLVGGDAPPPKPQEAADYMGHVHCIRSQIYGNEPGVMSPQAC